MKDKKMPKLATNMSILLFTLLVSNHAGYAQQAAAETTDAATKSKMSATSHSTIKSATKNPAQVAVDAGTSLNATESTESEPLDIPVTPITKDPYQRFNRVMFTFNDKLDIYFLKPVATFYNTIMPKPLNQGIHNVFSNVGELPTIANDILQLNFYQMTNDVWRLVINTTIGVGGLFDVASRIGLTYYANDFGLTLATYGWKNSNYLVLPFFGPGTIRDTFEIPVDYYGFSIYPYIQPQSTQYAVYGLGVIDRRAQLLQFQDVVEEISIDKYIFMRNAYMQRRAYQIEQNRHLGVRDQQQADSAATEDNNKVT